MKMENRFEHEHSVDFNDGDCIFAEGDLGRDLYIIQSGSVIVLKNAGVQRIEIAQFHRGDFFGEMALLQSTPRSAGAFAQGPTKLLVLNPAGFLLKIRRDPTFAFEMLQQMSQRVKIANDRLTELIVQFRLPQAEVQKILIEQGDKL